MNEMEIAVRHERQRILQEIDKLEIGRCRECSGSALNDAKMNCGCGAAVAIRKLGDALIATTRHTRKKRIAVYLKQAVDNGLTVELYRDLRELDVDIKALRQELGWTVKQITEWRRENGLYESKVTEAPEVVKRKGNIAEQIGLTLDAYLNAKKIGYLDREIRRQ